MYDFFAVGRASHPDICCSHQRTAAGLCSTNNICIVCVHKNRTWFADLRGHQLKHAHKSPAERQYATQYIIGDRLLYMEVTLGEYVCGSGLADVACALACVNIIINSTHKTTSTPTRQATMRKFHAIYATLNHAL